MRYFVPQIIRKISSTYFISVHDPKKKCGIVLHGDLRAVSLFPLQQSDPLADDGFVDSDECSHRPGPEAALV